MLNWSKIMIAIEWNKKFSWRFYTWVEVRIKLTWKLEKAHQFAASMAPKSHYPPGNHHANHL